MVLVGLDTETGLTTRYNGTPDMVCASFAGGQDSWGLVQDYLGEAPAIWHREHNDGWVLVADRLLGARIFLDLIDTPTVRLIGHNAPYDLAVLAHEWAQYGPQLGQYAMRSIFRALDAGRILDTEIRDRLLHIANGSYKFHISQEGRIAKTDFYLSSLVLRWFGEDISESKTDPNAWRLRYRELAHIPPAQWPQDALEYAALDAYWPLVVSHAQSATELIDGRQVADKAANSVFTETRELSAAFAMHLMSVHGVRTGPEQVARTLATWQRIARQGKAVGQRAGFVRVKGRDKGRPGSLNKKVLQGLIEEAYTSRGAVAPMTEPTKTFPGGQVKTDEETLSNSGSAVLRAYARTLTTQLNVSRWQDPLLAATIAPAGYRANILVESGRTSISDPPWQQPPREGGVRDCVEPEPGMVFCGCDYTAVELCTLSQVCLWTVGHSTLGDTINAGKDPHLVTALSIMQQGGHPDAPETYEEILKRYQDGDPLIASESGFRFASKAVNFGFPGGLGPPAFVEYAYNNYGLRFTEDQARAFKDAWLAAYPEMTQYFKWVKRELERGDTVQQFVSGRVMGCEGRVTKAYNTFFQGLAADGAKYAMWILSSVAYTGRLPPSVHRAMVESGSEALVSLSEDFYGSRPTLFLHDELLSSVPIARSHEAAMAKRDLMVWAMRRHVPDYTIKAEPVLMTRWYKGAKPRYEAGRLVVSK